jgi:hypothetical protein
LYQITTLVNEIKAEKTPVNSKNNSRESSYSRNTSDKRRNQLRQTEPIRFQRQTKTKRQILFNRQKQLQIFINRQKQLQIVKRQKLKKQKP